MRSGYGFILTLFLVFSVLSTACISEDIPENAPVGVNTAQAGVLIQNIGDITGQGVILEGVPRGTIDTVTFTVGLAQGVKSIDLNNMTIVYTDAVRTETFSPVEGYRGNPHPGYWGIIDTINPVGDPNLRLEYEEQVTLRINPKAAVVPNQVITISIKPREGKPLILRHIAPTTIGVGDIILPGL